MSASVRYIVADAAAGTASCSDVLGFVLHRQAPGFAMLSRGDMLLPLNEPGVGGAGRAGAGGGRSPAPGGWARLVSAAELFEPSRSG